VLTSFLFLFFTLTDVLESAIAAGFSGIDAT
jgi:hypothetical protein